VAGGDRGRHAEHVVHVRERHRDWPHLGELGDCRPRVALVVREFVRVDAGVRRVGGGRCVKVDIAAGPLAVGGVDEEVRGVGTVAAEGFDDPVALVAERDDVDAAFGDAGDRGVHTDVLRGGQLNHPSNRAAASADRCDRGDAGAAPERSVPVTSREVTYHENR